MADYTYLTAIDFTRLIFARLNRYRYVILITAVAGAVLMGVYAKYSPQTYTSTATIFSLSSTNDNPGASSAISLLLGGETNKSFSDETSINIVELAQSRAISEAVAAIPVPSMGNKIIASLFMEDINTHRGLMQSAVKPPQNKDDLIILAGIYLRSAITATINKNNSFVLSFTGKSEELVKVISYGYIDKISQFYIDIKREKAKRDYEFASGKVDSLKKAMRVKDYAMIAMDNKTLFTNTDKLQYRVPAENVEDDKQMIHSQYSQAIINQQAAAYKLQKDTPLIRVLDNPDPPYEVNSKSAGLYAILGLLLAGFFVSGIIISKIFFKYTRQEISRALFGSVPPNTTTTAPASRFSE